jgi:diguanylate cyclase (GGDEF)-like protein
MTSLSANPVSLDVLAAACEAAEAELERPDEGSQALDRALDCLRAGVGPELACCVFLREHDRLWLLAQRGYDMVRDGYTLEQGVMARAIRAGRVQYVADVRRDADYVAATEGIVSEVAAPFGGSKPALGVLNVETRDRTLPREAGQLLGRLARRLGSLVDSAEGAPRLDLSTLARLFVHASSLRDVEAISELAARSLGRLLDLESAQVNVGAPGGSAELVSFWRRPDSTLEPLGLSSLARLAAAVDPSAACSLLDLRTVRLGRAAGRGRRGVIWLPLRAGGGEVGILVGAARRPLAFELDQAETAKLLAAHAAASLDAASALARERRAAVTDPLTALLNRRGFEDRFGLELERSERAGEPLSVIVLDCDNFKAINDRGGHEVGDRTLVAIARYFAAIVRAEDVVARLGGEEFAVLLPGAEPASALRVAERLRRGIGQHVTDDRGRPIAASFGVATYPNDGRSATELVRAADQAMYLAKRSGKNQTIAFAQLRQLPRSVFARDESLALDSMIALTQVLDEGYLRSNAHSRLVGTCARLVGERLGLAPETCERLWIAGLLHDLGKVALPERILAKPGPLDDDEWVEVRRHPELGAHMLERARDEEMRLWIRCHHERPDGGGYPDGLLRDDIPLGARIVAVADAFEAMVSPRPYRSTMSVAEAVAELRRCAGTQFDPSVVEALVATLEDDRPLRIEIAAA